MLTKVKNAIQGSEALSSMIDSAMTGLKSTANSGQKYARAYAAMLTCLVAADFDFEVKEFQQSIAFIQNDAKLKDMNLVMDTINYFEKYTDTIKEVMSAGDYKFPIIQAQMIQEISRVPDQYKMDIVRIVDMFLEYANNDERAVCALIKDALV